MTNIALLDSTSVLHRQVGLLDDPVRVKFTREPDEEGDVPVVVYLPLETWSDFGCPETITVRVDPRDTLNDPDGVGYPPDGYPGGYAPTDANGDLVLGSEDIDPATPKACDDEAFADLYGDVPGTEVSGGRLAFEEPRPMPEA